ncbi:MED14-domain-containing protein [Periconia macrospinosa]|uniref:Mediator of RNA polymerase II transcription subunit 14 n=1 Tax=Periconia macrospinosa TaxID=97972 RepID=A0A2V1ECI4_9PLEO|nr:MED14-domain-containing protein [Periconia macrospinosa]
MPGILKMDPNGANGTASARDGDTKKRTYDGRFVNGDRNTPRPEASKPSTSMADQVAQLPPELAHVAASSYHPLSTLIERVNQECFNDLNDVLNAMAAIPTHHQTNGAMPNGLGSHNMGGSGRESAEANQQKKQLLIKFAQESRAKMIKLLVLTDWGKKSAAEISKLIDIFGWTRAQSADADAADVQLLEMKLLSNEARQRNPDIRTALEILATKKAEWLPDMGYIPPEPITSEKALHLLRYMNTSLYIRLTVHEKLPHHLRKWRVGSGRATFIVENEFEFDVMSFVEDTSDQWHFIDFRLLFSPAPVIDVDSRFLRELKLMMDGNLATEGKGLEECFNFLHNFTLTHKISVLRSQANELLRGAWAGSLRVESPHRQLVFYYWTDRPGKKSWIEIGISSNRPKDGKVSWRGPSIPSLTARWFRQGVEVKDVDLKIDWNNLSAERTLKHVVALHIGHLLHTARMGMFANASAKEILSTSEPADCRLVASLGASANKVTLSVQPATGRYILQPINMLSAQAEHAINRPYNPPSPSNAVTHLLAQALVGSVHKCAQQLGWHQVGQQSLRHDAVKTATKQEVIQFAIYQPRGWSVQAGSKWAIAMIVNAVGESWWLCKIGPANTTIEHAQQMNMERPKSEPDVTRATLSAIARVAVNAVAIHTNVQMLQQERMAFTLANDFAESRTSQKTQVIRGLVLHLKTSDLLASNSGEDAWLEPRIRLACHGLRVQSHKVWHIAAGTMIPAVAADMKKLMASSPQRNFNFSDDGHFQILIDTPFGEEVISKLKTRLRDIYRLRTFATILQKRKMLLVSSSLEHVKFQYGRDLTATVRFDKEDKVEVEFGKNAPHVRIQRLLNNVVNDTKRTSTPSRTFGLDAFCITLLITRPLLSAFDAIEASNTTTFGNPVIHTHSIGVYRLTYANPVCSFDVRLKQKGDRALWFIEDNEKKPTDLRPKNERTPNYKRPDALNKALRSLLDEKTERWYGVNTGIIAEIDGVPEALKRLHQVVMAHHDRNAAHPSPPANIKPVIKGSNGAPEKTNGVTAQNRPGGGGVGGGGGGNAAGGAAQLQRPPFNKANAFAGKAQVKREVIEIDD